MKNTLNNIELLRTGMITDINDNLMSENSYRYMLNGTYQNFDGNGLLILQNELSNFLLASVLNNGCIIGHVNVFQKDKTFFFVIDNNLLKLYYISNNEIYCKETGNTTIEYNDCIDCKSNVETSDVKENVTNFIFIKDILCFNYTCETKLDVEYKINDCNLELYWVDKLNELQYLIINTDNYTVLKDFLKISHYTDNDCKQLVYTTELDCNKLSINLCFTKLKIDIVSIGENGNLKEGSYQFLLSYSDENGNLLSNYISLTNIILIFETKIKNDYGLYTNKSIKIKISNLDELGLFKYYNLLVGETINNFTTFYKIDTFNVAKNTYVYTGLNKDKFEVILLSSLFSRKIVYGKAGGITQSNDYLFYYNLEGTNQLNLQQAANFVKANWFTTEVLEDVYSKLEDTFYKRTFQRDEVYSFGIVYENCDGSETCAFLLIGRNKNECDIEIINNCDIISSNNSCETNSLKESWEVYNTASITKQLHEKYDLCKITIWEEGEFAYYQSTETYLNELNVWGDLCGKLIRHFKFLDSVITHIHDRHNNNLENSYNEKNNLYLIGIKIDHQSVIDGLTFAVNNNLITIQERSKIVSYRIVRGNRVGNKSIIAKGLIYDMWSYEENKVGCTENLEKIYYLNYLFNDLNADQFLSATKGIYDCDYLVEIPQQFHRENKYTFHSLDTHFNNPLIGSYLKLETNEHGECDITFTKSENHSKYKIPNKNGVRAIVTTTLAYLTCVRCGEGEGFFNRVLQDLFTLKVCEEMFNKVNILNYNGSSFTTTMLLSNIDFYTMYKQFEELILGFEKYKDVFWQYQAIGNYNNYQFILNNGNKIRLIKSGSYLTLDYQTVETNTKNITVNNWNRESSLMIDLGEECLLLDTLVIDNSRSKVKKDSTTGTPKWFISVNVSSFDKTFQVNYTNQDGIVKDIDIYNLYYNLFNGLYRADYTMEICSKTKPIVTSDVKITYFVRKLDEKCYQTCFCDQKLKKNISSYYASIKNNFTNQYGNIFDIEWLETNSNSYSLTEDNNKYLFGGDTFISKMSLKRKLQLSYNLPHKLLNGSDIIQSELYNVAYLNYYIDMLTNILKNGFADLLDDKALIAFSAMNQDCNGDGNVAMINSLSEAITDSVYKKIKCNRNLDCESDNNEYLSDGIVYSYIYGILYYWVESDVNLQYRNAENNLEKNFYLNTTDLNNWLQEDNVPIKYDNTYHYDKSYSKQIKESFICTGELNNDFKSCKSKYLNRVIYSEQNSFNNFKLNNYYDFLFKDGSLISLDGIENDKVLARFEDKLKVFNAYVTILTSADSIQIGNGGMFQSKLQEYAETDLGYAGTQHQAILHTEHGHIWVDAKRGDIFLLGSNNSGLTEISQLGMNQWFKENLLFEINNKFNTIIDNERIGILLSYDKRYSRFFLTKLDYKILNDNIIYNNGKFILNGLEVDLDDKKYFCNKSFTIGFDLKNKQWLSFYSFILDRYIDYLNYILSVKGNGLWAHNLRKQSYQKFYNKLYLFVIDYNQQQNFSVNTLNSIEYNTELLRYHDNNDFYYDKNKILFNKAYVYNKNQNSGLLEFEKNQHNNLSNIFNYLKDKINKWIILISNAEYKWRFNYFFDLVKDRNFNKLLWNHKCNGHELVLNNNLIDYNKDLIKALRIRQDNTNIRLINDVNEFNKILFKWNNLKQVKSYR